MIRLMSRQVSPENDKRMYALLNSLSYFVLHGDFTPIGLALRWSMLIIRYKDEITT